MTNADTAGRRLIIVSNRLPVTVRHDGDALHVERSMGGLARGLAGPHESSGGLWIGWPGDLTALDETQRSEVAAQLRSLRTVPVTLSREEVDRYYEGFANGVLWPLCHYLLDRIPYDARDWAAYELVNRRFADLVVEHARPGDRVWIHDYHLMLLPRLLRERLPDLSSGFFLHIPFPAEEVFRLLPWRREILEGLLGADLVGFHTQAYARHFGDSLVRVLGLDSQAGEVRLQERIVRFGAFPMGVDARGFDALAQTPPVERAARRFRGPAAVEKVVVGIDRLDYTKGIPRRLLAFERLLEQDPPLRGRIRFIQVAVPSRERVPAYKDYRRTVNELVGRINGAYGTLDLAPVHYLARGFGESDVTALYRAADVLMVTPLRDGMNLVAKEFAAARFDGDGVLLLSEFAGAASELAGAVIVNPYDVDGTAAALREALQMPRDERRRRMRTLRRRVFAHDIHDWARSFLETLDRQRRRSGQRRWTAQPAPVVTAELAREPLTLLLDYDGTLVPFAPTPPEAAPDVELRTLLQRLGELAGVEVHLVSGRARGDLESWFSGLPIALTCEHGLWSRDRAGHWRMLAAPAGDWRALVRPTLEVYTEYTPGTFIEPKSSGLAWHFRNAPADFGQRQANELRLQLASLAARLPVEVLLGDHVVEVRQLGIHKGLAAIEATQHRPGVRVLAAGDDLTDEDLFAALPAGSLSIKVGTAGSLATHRLPDVKSVRAFLAELASRRARSRR
jgi:trehalose 6-phosphate synthase/phosphatase